MFAAFWVEGVDFESTVDDTSDLSTIRGATLALNRFGEDLWRDLSRSADDTFKPEIIRIGAAQAVFFLEGDRARIQEAINSALSVLDQGADSKAVRLAAQEGLRNATRPEMAPYAHLSFTHGVGWCESDDEDGKASGLEQAKAAARLMQMRQFSVRDWRWAGKAERPCQIDRARPADDTIMVNADRAGERADIQEGTGVTSLPVSSAVAARRHFGRAQRQAFYRETLPADHEERAATTAENKRLFADSLHDIVECPPNQLTASPRGKIALFYADGNRFSDIRAKLGRGVSAQTEFAERLQRLMTARLLPSLLEPFLSASLKEPPANQPWVAKTARGPRIRFETLLWGGDEVCFVVPAWLGLDLAARFFECVEDWQIGSPAQRLTFSAGLVMASYKTPIRSLREMARGLAEMAKSTGSEHQNKLAVEILESIEPQSLDVMGVRKAMLGLAKDSEADFVIDADGPHLKETLARLMSLKAQNGLPRSQLYQWLQQAVRDRLFDPETTEASSALDEAVDYYLSHAGDERGFSRESLNFEPDAKRPLATSLYMTSLLWDYVDPLNEAGPAA